MNPSQPAPSSEYSTADIAIQSSAKVSIIPLEATLVRDAIRVHREAFHGYMNTLLGDTYLRAFFKWFQQSKRRIAVVAQEEAGNTLGYVVGAPLDEKDELNRTLLRPAAGGLMVRPWLIFNGRIVKTAMQRLKTLWGGKPPQRPDEPNLSIPVMSLVGIGVSAEARGRGIGIALMAAFEQRAIELTMSSLRLSVYSSNASARRLYERCGWTAGTVPLDPAVAMYYWKSLR